jgi:hypothetical protein
VYEKSWQHKKIQTKTENAKNRVDDIWLMENRTTKHYGVGVGYYM